MLYSFKEAENSFRQASCPFKH